MISSQVFARESAGGLLVAIEVIKNMGNEAEELLGILSYKW